MHEATGYDEAVTGLARDLPRLRAAEAGARLAGLRRIAQGQGLDAAAEVAGALAAAIGRDRAGTPLGPWIDALAQAGRCGRQAGAASLLLATVAVRFGD